MQTMKLAVLAWLALFCSLAFSSAGAACLKVADDSDLKINAQAASNFQNELGIDRAGLFAALNEISQTETGGCWATPTGDFDGQIVSVGTAQWNYGQKSLQPLLISYKAHFLTQAAFDQDIAKIMPKYGSVIFSKGCLSTNGTGAGGLSVECVTEILGHQHNKNLDADITAEFEALFNSETMRQIQLDKFIRLMGTIRDDVARTWLGRRPTPVQIQWAIDTKVQQGSLLPDSTVKRLRAQIAQSTPENLKEMELGVVEWYHGALPLSAKMV